MDKSLEEMRISKEERNLLQITFKDRPELLVAIRNLFFGIPLSEAQTVMIEGLNGPAMCKLLRKIFLPELEGDIPIGQSIDLWMTIKIDDINLIHYIQAREILILNLEKALHLLEDPHGEKVNLNMRLDVSIPDITTALIARNTFITHVEQQLLQIKFLSLPQETQDQIRKRNKKDSSK